VVTAAAVSHFVSVCHFPMLVTLHVLAVPISLSYCCHSAAPTTCQLQGNMIICRSVNSFKNVIFN